MENISVQVKEEIVDIYQNNMPQHEIMMENNSKNDIIQKFSEEIKPPTIEEVFVNHEFKMEMDNDFGYNEYDPLCIVTNEYNIKQNEDVIEESKQVFDRSLKRVSKIKHITIQHDGDYSKMSRSPKKSKGGMPTTYKPYICSECNFRTNIRSHLERHFRSHTGEKPFSCSLCEHRTARKCNLLKHMKTVHAESKLKSFTSNNCSSTTSNEDCLEKNTRQQHTRVKPFKCNMCDCKSAGKNDLTRGHKLISCHLCSYKAVTKSSLRDHLLTHMKEKLNECSFCSYKAVKKQNLDRHVQKFHSSFS